MKFNLDKKILNIKGEPVIADVPVRGVSEGVLREMVIYRITDLNALKEQVEKWQEDLKETERKPVTIRDYFLTVLGSRFEMKDRNREPFWTTGLGILFSNTKMKIVEVEDEKADFLKRIIKNNRIKQQMPMGGEIEIDLFFPYELGQLLKLFEGETK